MIQQNEGKHSVADLCKASGIAPSTYYRWKRDCGKTARQREDEPLRAAIVQSWKRSRKNYGSPRVEQDLRNQGIRTSRKRVARLMREAGIQGCFNCRKKPLITDSRHGGRISKNKLKQQPFPTGLRQVVVTDTTYIWTDEGWHYLATVMDLFSREILGWDISKNNDKDLVCRALWKASGELKGHQNVLHHSDRGSTYCSEKYRELMASLRLESSMSAKGYCYDNAHMESFFGSLKCECPALAETLSPPEMKLAVFDYIEGFYNTHRIHTALNGSSPRQFARRTRAAAGSGLLTPPSPTSFEPILDGA